MTREALLRIFDLAEDRPDIRDVARAALAADAEAGAAGGALTDVRMYDIRDKANEIAVYADELIAANEQGAAEDGLAAALDAIEKALKIGGISHDGDGWFAADAGYGYDEADAAFEEARVAVAKVRAVLLDAEAGGTGER